VQAKALKERRQIMSGPTAKPDAVTQEYMRQAARWWVIWRWWLIALIAVVWVPVFIDLIHDLWMLAHNRGEAFLGLPELFFNRYASWSPSLYQLNSGFIYYTPPVRRLIAFAAALGLAGHYRLTAQQVGAQSRGRLYSGYLRVVRHAVYAWMALLLLGPSLFSMVLFYTDYQLATTHLHLMITPALLLLADWISLCEMQVLIVVRRIGPSTAWRFAIAVLVGGIYLLVNYYTPILFDMRVESAPDWTAALVDTGLIGISVLLALLWWYLTRRPPAGFPERFIGPAANAIGRVENPLDTVLALVKDPKTQVYSPARGIRLSAFGGMLLLIIGIIWLQVMRSGVLYDPDCYPIPDLTIPVISTRGSCSRGKLSGGCSGYEYKVIGGLPGLVAGTKAPTDLVVVIHGFNNNDRRARYKFDMASAALRANGYDGALAGWSWDADTQRDPLGTTGYHSADDHAILNGRMLAQFAVDYKRACPNTRLHVLGYSMGARVALEALKALDDDPRFARSSCRIDTVHLLGAAVDNEEVELDRQYGQAIQDRAGRLFNYYSLEDNALAGFYGFKELDLSLGQGCIEHPQRAPANYVSVNAAQELKTFDRNGNLVPDTLGDNHMDYLGTKDERGVMIDDGAMNLVAENIYVTGELAKKEAELESVRQLLRERRGGQANSGPSGI
jgi:pimeloyl-ACP methyl ester carboxylesterase